MTWKRKKPEPQKEPAMPAPSDLDLRDLRRGVQQMYMGFASLLDGDKHRQSAYDLVHDSVVELNLTVRGERGEVIDDMAGAIDAALDEVKDFTADVPHEEA